MNSKLATTADFAKLSSSVETFYRKRAIVGTYPQMPSSSSSLRSKTNNVPESVATSTSDIVVVQEPSEPTLTRPMILNAAAPLNIQTPPTVPAPSWNQLELRLEVSFRSSSLDLPLPSSVGCSRPFVFRAQENNRTASNKPSSSEMLSQVEPPINSTSWDSQTSTPSNSPSSVLSEVDNRFCFTTTWDDEQECASVSAAARDQDDVGFAAIWEPSRSLPSQSSPPPAKNLEVIHPQSFLPPVDDRSLALKVSPTSIKENPKVDARGSKWAKAEQRVVPAAIYQKRPYLGLEATTITAKTTTSSAATAVAAELNANTVTPRSELHIDEGAGSEGPGAVKMAKFIWGGVDLLESAASMSLTQDEKIDFIERGGTFSKLEDPATPISEFRNESDSHHRHKGHHLIKHQQRQQKRREDHHQNHEHRTKKIWYDREFLMRFKMYRIAPDGFVDTLMTLQGTVDVPMTKAPEDSVSSAVPTRSLSPHHLLATGEPAQHPRHSIGGNINLTFAGIAKSNTQWTPGAVTGCLGGRQFCYGKVREPVGPPPSSAKSTLSRGFRSRTQL